MKRREEKRREERERERGRSSTHRALRRETSGPKNHGRPPSPARPVFDILMIILVVIVVMILVIVTIIVIIITIPPSRVRKEEVTRAGICGRLPRESGEAEHTVRAPRARAGLTQAES